MLELAVTSDDNKEHQKDEIDSIIHKFYTETQGPMSWECWRLLYLASKDPGSNWFQFPIEIINYIPWIHGLIIPGNNWQSKPDAIDQFGKTLKANSHISQISDLYMLDLTLDKWLDIMLTYRQQLYALQKVNLLCHSSEDTILNVSLKNKLLQFLSSSDSLQILELISQLPNICNDVIFSLANRNYSLHQLSMIMFSCNSPLSVPENFVEKNSRLVKLHFEFYSNGIIDYSAGLLAFSSQLSKFTRLKDLKMPVPHKDAVSYLANFVADSWTLRSLNATHVVADQESLDKFINALNTSPSLQALSFHPIGADLSKMFFDGLAKACKLSFLNFRSTGEYETSVDAELLNSIKSFLQSNQSLNELHLMFPEQYISENLFSQNVKAPITSLSLHACNFLPQTLISPKDLPLLEHLSIETKYTLSNKSKDYIMEWAKDEAWFDPTCKLQSMHLHVFRERSNDMDVLQKFWADNGKKLAFYKPNA